MLVQDVPVEADDPRPAISATFWEWTNLYGLLNARAVPAEDVQGSTCLIDPGGLVAVEVSIDPVLVVIDQVDPAEVIGPGSRVAVATAPIVPIGLVEVVEIVPVVLADPAGIMAAFTTAQVGRTDLESEEFMIVGLGLVNLGTAWAAGLTGIRDDMTAGIIGATMYV